MGFLSFFTEFLRDIRIQKLRTFLTIIGIMWGTATIIVLVSVSIGIREQIMLNVTEIGDDIVILSGSQTSRAYEGLGIGRWIRLHEDDALFLKENIPEIRNISPEYLRRGVPIRRNDITIRVHLGGVIPSYYELRNIYPQEGGRWINDLDMLERKRVIFLGDELKWLLFGNQNAVGEVVMVGGTPFTVVGVMQPKSQSHWYVAQDEERAFIPSSTFSTMYGTDRVRYIIYNSYHHRYLSDIESNVFRLLSRKYKFHSEDRNALWLWDTTDIIRFYSNFFIAFTIFLGFIGTLTLSVGGIGVANIMLVVVQERRHDIGVMRAVGARRGDITRQFFIETFMILGAGGVLGFAAGWLVVSGLRFLPQNITDAIGVPSFTSEAGLITFIILLLIGLAAGMMPARKAARLNVVECLRS